MIQGAIDDSGQTILQRACAVVVCVLAIFLAGCGRDSSEPAAAAAASGNFAAPRTITVVATTTMIADLARQIAEPDAKVISIMKPGEDPHVYDVRTRDAQVLADADVILANGLHLESTLERLIRNNARGKFVMLAEDPRIKPIFAEGHEGAPDPHCWFSVPRFKIYAEAARDALVNADPAHAKGYTDRATAYLAKLDELDQWVRSEISKIPRPQRVVVTSHDAFHYFGNEYDLDMLAVIGISTEQAPKPDDITKLIQTVQSRNVRALFIETSVANTLNDILKKVSRETGARIGGSLYSDSLGEPGTPTGTYIGVMRHNVNTIVEALK